MKKIIKLFGIILLFQGLSSCTNQNWDFPDFDYTTTYFPYQYPARTLVLGDYYFDNTNDNGLKFLIGAHMGGVYENKKDIPVGFVVDESLVENLFNAQGIPIRALPKAYYTLSNESEILIPSGKLQGGIEVQLKPSFLDDTLAIAPLNSTNYVIPLRITSSTTDSILVGSTSMQNPDPRIAANWTVKPKNFTLFGIKYVNEYHGKYLLRGASQIKALDGSDVETIVYRQKYIERNPVVALTTFRKNVVKYTNSIKRTVGGSPGSFEMTLTFDGNDACVIANTTKYPGVVVTGIGKRVKNAEEWGGKKYHTIYLDYKINVASQVHSVKDTLVFRDKGIIFEEFVPSVILP